MAGRSSSTSPQGEQWRFPTMPLPVRVLEMALPGGGNVILSAGEKRRAGESDLYEKRFETEGVSNDTWIFDEVSPAFRQKSLLSIKIT